MSNFFLIISPYLSFDEGTLLLVEKDKLTEVDSNISIEFNNDINKDWIEINPEFISDLKKLDKNKRLDMDDENLTKYFLSKSPSLKATEDLSNLILSNSYTFLRRDSSFNGSRFKDYDANIRKQLVKIRGIKNIYGHKTKYYTEKNKRYAAITLLHGSINDVKTLYPENHFDKNDNNNGDFDLMVDEEFIKLVKNNLILMKNSPFIDKNYIVKTENCECGRFSINDYVKIKNGRMVGKVVCCVKINEQHCIKFNSVDGTSEDLYIREEDVTKKGVSELIKYCEGVVVDPISILKLEISEFEEFKVNDMVTVTLRDSGSVYESKIVWLGKVNDINVAAVKSIANLRSSSLENLMWDGKFKDKTFNIKKSYLISLSSIKKIPPEGLINQSRIEAIAQSLKNNKITDQVSDELSYMHQNVSSFSFPPGCFDQILKLSTIILKNFNRGFIPKILENLSLSSEVVIEDYDKLLVKCSITVLNIICDLCIDNIDKISSNAPLMEVLEHIFDKLNFKFDVFNDIKEIFSSIMFIFWNINKNGIQMTDKFSRIFSIFQENNLDPNLKLVAALNIAFLLNDQSCDVSMVVKYLIERNRGPLVKERNQRFIKSDISSGLGKIFEFCECYDKSGSTSVGSHSEKLTTASKDAAIISSDDNCGTLYEEDHFKNNTKLTSIEYEKCINIFVDKDNTRESLFYLLNNLAIMNDKECIQRFIKTQPPVELEESLVFLMNIRHNNETLKTLLENCIVKPKEYKNMINLANKLLIEKNNGNINLLLNQIQCPTEEDLDSELLSLAYTSIKYSDWELFTNILAKCKDVNSVMCNGETFLTFIIKDKDIREISIIEAIEVGGFDINKKNKQNETPSVLATTNQRKEVFTFLADKNFNVMDLYDHFQNYNHN